MGAPAMGSPEMRKPPRMDRAASGERRVRADLGRRSKPEAKVSGNPCGADCACDHGGRDAISARRRTQAGRARGAARVVARHRLHPEEARATDADRIGPPRNRFATGSQRLRNRLATASQPIQTGDPNPINGLPITPQRMQRIPSVATVGDVHDVEDPAAGRRLGP
jgi:hypothetical protein